MKESMDPWMKSLTLSSSSEWLLISQGAEARVWKVPAPSSNNNDTDVGSSSPPQPTLPPSFIICKERFPKKYRHPILDERLIKARVRAEVKALEKCWTAATTSKDESLLSLLRVPKVLRVDAPLIYLEYLQGQSVRAYLEDLLEKPETTGTQEEDSTATTTTKQQLLQELAKTMGKTVATLHSLGIIHGDLTTSNMMLLPSKDGDKESKTTTNSSSSPTPLPSSFSLALIDFGLAKNGTISVEERAVDLYVLERALEATHPQVGDDFSVTLLDAYGQQMNHQNTSAANNNNNKNNNKASKSKDASVSNSKNTKQYNSGDAILQRLDKVRQRGRKRECFG